MKLLIWLSWVKVIASIGLAVASIAFPPNACYFYGAVVNDTPPVVISLEPAQPLTEPLILNPPVPKDLNACYASNMARGLPANLGC